MPKAMKTFVGLFAAAALSSTIARAGEPAYCNDFALDPLTDSYDAAQCGAAWKRDDWNVVIDACNTAAQDEEADPRDFVTLTFAAASRVRAAVAEHKTGQEELYGSERDTAINDLKRAIDGLKGSQEPTDAQDLANAIATKQALESSAPLTDLLIDCSAAE